MSNIKNKNLKMLDNKKINDKIKNECIISINNIFKSFVYNRV